MRPNPPAALACCACLASITLGLLGSCTPMKKDVRLGQLHTLTIYTTHAAGMNVAKKTYLYDSFGKIASILTEITPAGMPTTTSTATYVWLSASPPLSVVETRGGVALTWNLDGAGLATDKSGAGGTTTFVYDKDVDCWKFSQEPTGYTDTRTIDGNGDIIEEDQSDPRSVGKTTAAYDLSAPNYNDGRRFQGSNSAHMQSQITVGTAAPLSYSYRLYPDGKVMEQDSLPTGMKKQTFTYYPN